MTAIDKYLARYAAPEASVADVIDEHYAGVLVVPICDEPPEFIEGLTGAGDERTWLIIVVANATEDSSAEVHQRNSLTMDRLGDSAYHVSHLSDSPPIEILHLDDVDLLLVDRASGDHLLPPGEGVGLARRIGCDIALALQRRGSIDSPWIHTTDADVTLPPGYLAAARDRPSDEVALAYPFRHECQPDRDGEALALYDMSLRYYVRGLEWAGSRWAFHTIGSTLAVRGEAYAQVRGVPRRLAGEDFYLLAKIAKLGNIGVPDVEPILIRQRASNRVPFGTGTAMRDIAAALENGESFAVYDPIGFELLRRFHDALEATASGEDIAAAANDLPDSHASALRAAMDRIGAAHAVKDARARVTSAKALARRLSDWFDAFRTLAFIHAVRDNGFPKRPWREALDDAPFCDDIVLLRDP